MKLAMFLILAAATTLAEAPHDTPGADFGATQVLSVPGFRARIGSTCGRRICERCKVRCLECMDGCCQACVTSESYTRTAVENICAAVGGNPAPVATVQRILGPLKIRTPVWAQENTITIGPFGSIRRISGSLVLPDGRPVAVSPNSKAPAVCKIN